MWKIGTSALLVGMQYGVAMVENGMAVHPKIEQRIAIWSILNFFHLLFLSYGYMKQQWRDRFFVTSQVNFSSRSRCDSTKT